jgi:hypothetical protein
MPAVLIDTNIVDRSTEKGIWVDSSGGTMKVLNNTVTNTSSNRYGELGLGIHVSGGFSDNQENVVDSNKVVNSAAFGISFSTNASFVKVVNNIVDGVSLETLGYGDCIHVDSSNSKLAIFNNTLNQCQRIGVYAEGNNDILLLNNLVLNSGFGIEQKSGSSISWSLDGLVSDDANIIRTKTFQGAYSKKPIKKVTRSVQSGHNLVWNTNGSTSYYKNYTGETSTDIHEDPLLGVDYKISNSSSPAVDGGQYTSFLPEKDFFGGGRIVGEAVDIGAHELAP